MSLSTAEQLEANEQYDKAYEEYKKVYSQKPNNLGVLERLGHIATILDKNEDATEYYNKILELDPKNELAYDQLMDIYVHTDKYKYYVSRGNKHVLTEELSHAVNDFKKALANTQSIEEMNSIRFVLASLYEQMGKNHSAIDEFLKILDTSATNELVFLKLAEVYVREDSIASAIETLERARENNFDTPAIKENLAQLYLKNNQPDKARELTQDELVKVKSLLEEGGNQAAFDILQELGAEYKKNTQYHSLFAQYYFNTKNWAKALECVNEFDKYEKNSPLTCQMRALIYEEMGNDYDAHINWAKYNLARKDKDVALNEYLSAYQLKENDLILVRNIAELLEDIGDKNHAVEFWEKLVKLDSRNRKALEKIAEFRENIGDYRAEAETLEMLYQIDNRNLEIIKKLAKSYEKLRNKEKALEYYNKFISTAPVNDELEQIKQKVQKLESVEMEEDEGLVGKIMRLFARK